MPVNALMVGAGEYTTGDVHGEPASSDKSAGVIGISLFDLRRRGFVDQLRLASTSGKNHRGIREHLQRAIGDVYAGMDLTVECFPAEDVLSDKFAYRKALSTMSPGDVVTVFTPDDTHYQIAMDAIEKGCHVLIAKPLVKTAREHQALIRAAEKCDVLVAMEVHKRWDPIYADAKDRIRSLGDFSLFQSYMSQPKTQLETFRKWAGQSSDISYYLNAHHVDFLVWVTAGFARPMKVHASAATGVASGNGIATEDTIVLTVDWENVDSGSRGTSSFTASWIAPTSDVHSQQRFFYMGHQGEVTVDQAHRGYSVATDSDGYASANPLFMKYTPDAGGYFAGQDGYGYRSVSAFVDAANAIRAGQAKPSDFHDKLATAQQTLLVSAILEAGRRSLDEGLSVAIHYAPDGSFVGLDGE